MKKWKVVASLLTLVILGCLLGGCGGTSGSGGSSSGSSSGGSSSGGSSGSTEPIKIAFVSPLSGDAATYGLAGKRSMELFLEDFNAAGGIKGRKIELLIQDDTGDPKQAVTAAQKFGDQKDVLALVGSCLSSNTVAMVPVLEKAGLPHLAYASSSSKLSGISPNFYRIAVLDSELGKAMAQAAATRGAKKVGHLYVNNDYGKTLGQEVVGELKKLNVEVVGDYAYLANDRDFQAILTEVKGKQPDIVILSSTYTDAALITKQARQIGITAPLISHTSVFSSKFLEIAGEAAEGIYLPTCFVADNPDPKAQAFAKKFQEKYNMLPDNYNALAYDLIGTITDALKRAADANELTREGVKKALDKSNYTGITGTVKFNSKHDWERQYLWVTVKGGKFVLSK
ncbi:MAG: ABC transporter substrate-binding protein [Bacillota bacterium]